MNRSLINAHHGIGMYATLRPLVVSGFIILAGGLMTHASEAGGGHGKKPAVFVHLLKDYAENTFKAPPLRGAIVYDAAIQSVWNR